MKLSTVAVGAAAAGAIGLGVLTVPAGAGAEPTLPEVSAEELVQSVLAAQPPALGGVVEVDNALGLPALPGRPGGESPLTQPVTTFRVWADGHGRGRLALPSRGGEQVLVEDGTTLWRYDSSSRTATALPHRPADADRHAPVADPAQAAKELVGAVRTSSEVVVDGTGEVAGRPVYELVLTPKPTERTLLREVRVAVDSVSRVPLQLTVLADGSTDPALQIGFTDLDVGAQDPDLFRFTPPPGVTVQRPEKSPEPQRAPHGPGGRHKAGPEMIRTVGQGWDTVALGKLSTATGPDAETDPLAMVRQVGRPASGPWGNGWVVQTAVGTVLVASDGRFAAGAVPQQVLAEALVR
ncbi:MAG TPA: outer membrane lipoprotein carrier protein LolA [Pseudonocardiaceae bacterium]|nr:outer membrane lipoprotein carrier protein LolA [Pseudonocardiaceae bacterium]